VIAQPIAGPIPGMSMRRNKDGVPVLRIHYSACPRTSAPEWVSEQKRRYTSDAYWQLEMEMQYEAMSGQRVYPEFDAAVHVVPHSRIPNKLCRFMAIDPHPRTPHAVLWIGLDAWHDWYVYRELWPSVVYGQPTTLKDDQEDRHFTVRDYAETIATLEGNHLEWRDAEKEEESAEYRMNRGDVCGRCGRAVGQASPSCTDHRGPERIIERFMDQAGKGFIASGEHQQEESYADRYYRFGIQCADPIKSHKAGEDAIRQLLKPRKHEVYGVWPRVHISDRCPELQLELQKYRYKKTLTVTGEKELKQDGIEARSHLIDNLRYLACGRLTYVPELAS
jgi:hypothetical protein